MVGSLLADVLSQGRARSNESHEMVLLILWAEQLRSRIQGGHGLKCFPGEVLWHILARVAPVDEDLI
jgi:hypothetical protein